MNAYANGITDEEADSEEFRNKVDEYYKFNLATAFIIAIKDGMDFDAALDEITDDRYKRTVPVYTEKGNYV